MFTCDDRGDIRSEPITSSTVDTAAQSELAPRLVRRVEKWSLGGVAAGIADHLEVPRWTVRLSFIVLAFVHGIGIALYLVFWIMLDKEPLRADGISARTWRAVGRVAFFVAAVASVGAFTWRFDNPGTAFLMWSLLAIAGGAGLLWRVADARRRQKWESVAPTFPLLAIITESGVVGWIFRLATGGLLVVAGLVGILAVSGELDAVRDGFLFSAVTLVGVAIAAGPWLWRFTQELNAERAERIRSQERAEIAAVVHDKVLHTLALIQRAADNPREVTRLARGQERELRNWLYKPATSPDERFAAALEAAAAEVEDSYAVKVEPVLVGDAQMTGELAAVVGATREALVNAAKHAQVSSVSLYAEVEAGQVAVFVRDKGIGFDTEAIPDDRHGLHGSIIARMRRHGGTAVVVSTPGQGSEIRLTMPFMPIALYSGQPSSPENQG